MRHWREKTIRGSVLVHVTIDRAARVKCGDVFTRQAALERIRNALDQALLADPLGVRRYNIVLTSERISEPDPD